ncbi:POK18 protein, partial [Indicator maculatus]|nr:POK18 protein [Indicator maculatus]
PWKYLGWKILDQTIEPQNIQLKMNVKNLNDLQKFLGTINWICPYIEISNAELTPLF